jgi:hypothetical protein
MTTYEKFDGKISVVNENTIRFDEKTLIFFENSKDEYLVIFIKGLFYPNIITGNIISEIKSKEELENMSDKDRIFYNIARTDSLTIGYIDELKLLNPNHKTKRFIIWVFRKGMINPTAWYFELQNNKATRKTSLSEFIQNAKLTFCKSGTIII